MTEVKEVWVEMWEFPKYEISNLGNVRNAKTEKKLAIRQDGKEYRMVSIFDKKVHTKRVGRYVWQSFNKCSCKDTIDHINRDAGDDNLGNLRCVPMEFNNRNRKNCEYSNKYNLTPEIKKEIITGVKNGTHTTWTIMKKYHIPLNYIGTVIRRGSWEKYLDNE
jgi:hypothetical protein